MADDARDARRGLWNGFGDGMALALDLVVIPVLFGLLGWLLDRWLGTGPVLMLVVGGLATVGVFVRTYFTYMAKMRAEEKDKPWNRSSR